MKQLPQFWLSNSARLGEIFNFRSPREDEDDFNQSDALIMSTVAYLKEVRDDIQSDSPVMDHH